MDPGYAMAEPYRRARASVVTLRTFSKIYGLAGLRVGYAVCDARVATQIDRVRRPFNVSSVAQAAAVAALDDREHLERSCEAARVGLAALSGGLGSLGLRVLPSLGNFALIDLGGREAAPLYQALCARGVIMRPMGGWGLPRHLRASIGREADIARAVDAMRAALA
jgi:histidinol-phosphate aminotransferase